jgi:flagellar hook-associated protein 3 FlgL
VINILDPASQAFLAGINQIQQKLQNAQAQLTTGLKINNVSDDPAALPDLWQTRANLSQVQQINSNLGLVNTEANTAESVLQNAVSMVQRAETLGTQGANGTVDANTRNDLAGELGSVLQQLVSAANTQVGGRYIFAGDSDQTAPYAYDPTQAYPVSSYQGSPTTRTIQSPDGSTFAVALTAQQIFDSPNAAQNVFESISALQQALATNNSAGINAALGDVQSADTYLNQQLAFYGTVQDRVSSATNYCQNYITQLQTQLSGIQDADETQAITDLTQAQTQLQAALESRAQIPRHTLFDFLA